MLLKMFFSGGNEINIVHLTLSIIDELRLYRNISVCNLPNTKRHGRYSLIDDQ